MEMPAREIYTYVKSWIQGETLADANHYFTKGNEIFEQGRVDRACELFKKGVSILERLDPNGMSLSRAYITLGSALEFQKKLDESLSYYLKSLAIQQKHVSGTLKITEIYNALASLYALQGKTNTAIEYLEKSLKIIKQSSESTDCYTIYNDIGEVYMCLEKWDDALSWYLKSLSIQERLDLKGVDLISAYWAIGNIYYEKKNFEAAIKHLERAYTFQKQLTPVGVCTAQMRTILSELYDSLSDGEKTQVTE